MNNPKYPLELFLRVITVSLETMKIVEGLPGRQMPEGGQMAGILSMKAAELGTVVDRNGGKDCRWKRRKASGGGTAHGMSVALAHSSFSVGFLLPPMT